MSEDKAKKQTTESDRGKTDVPGQNPRQNDAVDQDVYHDETRKNILDPQEGQVKKDTMEGSGT
jgi:hypothetical protein